MNVRALVQMQNRRILTIPEGDLEDPDKTIFTMPGGPVEIDETPEQACGRHLKAQTGLTVKSAIYLYEEYENGVLTTTYDIDFKMPRYQEERDAVDARTKFIRPCHVIKGPQGPYNIGFLKFLYPTNYDDVVKQ